MSAPVVVGRPISLQDLEDVARRGRAVAFDPAAREQVVRSRAAIDAIASKGDDAARVYGVNTGFGALSETRISTSDVQQLQKNLVRSHSCGIGPDLGVPEVRGMMLLRAQVLALGCSGVRPELAARATGLKIPTSGVESLNAAVAAGILLYEARRQRDS